MELNLLLELRLRKRNRPRRRSRNYLFVPSGTAQGSEGFQPFASGSAAPGTNRDHGIAARECPASRSSRSRDRNWFRRMCPLMSMGWLRGRSRTTVGGVLRLQGRLTAAVRGAVRLQERLTELHITILASVGGRLHCISQLHPPARDGSHCISRFRYGAEASHCSEPIWARDDASSQCHEALRGRVAASLNCISRFRAALYTTTLCIYGCTVL